MKDEEIIKDLYIALSTASIEKDLKKLDDILADDYALIHMTGLNQTKQDYINSVKNSELEYYDAIHEDIKISINGDEAHVIGKTKTLASPFGMTKSWWKLKQDIVMKKVDGKWLIKSSKASTY